MQGARKGGDRADPIKANKLVLAVFDTLHIDLIRQGRSAGAMLILNGPNVADRGESIMSCRSTPMGPMIKERAFEDLRKCTQMDSTISGKR